jgi:replicative DNA helicase
MAERAGRLRARDDLVDWLSEWWCGQLLAQPERAAEFLAQVPASGFTHPLVQRVVDQIRAWEAAGRAWVFTDVMQAVPEAAAPLMGWMHDAVLYTDDASRLSAATVQELRRQQVRWALQDIARQVDTAEGDPIAVAEQAWTTATTTWHHTAQDVVEPAAAADLFAQWAQARADPSRTPVLPTPWPYLNRIGGGLGPEEFVLIAARTSVGKTAMLLQLATHIAERGQPLLFCSYEMGIAECLGRVVAQRWEVDQYRLQHGTLDAEGWDRVVTAWGTLADWPWFWMPDSATWRLEELAAAAQQLQRTHGLAAVFVDYLELVPLPGRQGLPQELGELANGLKALARRLHVPVVAAQQLSRDSEREGRVPELRHLRWSAGLEQAADKVWVLGRDPEDSEDRWRWCWVLKHRNGPRGEVRLAWEGPILRLREIARA